MKYIIKGQQPPELIAIHKGKDANGKHYTYSAVSDDKTKNKTIYTDTLASLIQEQGSICCYCMQFIDINSHSSIKPTIEHYIPQNPEDYKNLEKKKKLYHDKLGTKYQNMLATCHGNDKLDPDNKYCDKSKGNQFLKFLNPLDVSAEIVLGYGRDGSIVCLDDLKKVEVKKDIKTLNLNFQKLKDARKSIIEAVQKSIIIEKKRERNRLKNKFNKDEFKQKELAKCQMKNGKFKPYVQVMIYELNKI
ncbi:MAG: TIGR02646 family protein [uncultured Sulfurovum sp.]|uniref:TIGR02646 family protein n=1 Tax=uncultured Sulfurovum sp. TaxID=269237 RepID=A0A6S6STQ4_9BACT|nr:MAG: TIGR02646 family protein [uncultured Sulfurovum sp.]